ncbi:MAG: Na+/H+ antiporter NhaA [Pseudomonadota bacterium]|nr:Na+/H+ antiporter NhaA [Pseudomonadota bacterium]
MMSVSGSDRIRSALHAAAGSDAAAGLVLIVMTSVAMIAANSPVAAGYHALFHARLFASAGLAAEVPLPDLQAWINEALMAVFFFTVGLEIKREALIGDLATPARRRLPILAAAAGMIVPALVYLACIRGDSRLAAGWAIPTSTDIAFAIGVLGLVGRRLPASLRLFLLSVAVVDDLGAVTIIAAFYHAHTSAAWLAASGAVLAALLALNRCGCQRGSVYLAGSLLLWACVLRSGVHPAIAGVAAALTVPLRGGGRHGDPHASLFLRLEHWLSPWCAWLILPLFALANAGVSVVGASSHWFDAALQPLPLAVAVGLVIGKPLGIFGAVALAERMGVTQRPHGASWAQLWGVCVLAGIGFTMSLFIAALAFPAAPPFAETAKLGVLAGSAVSAMAGYIILGVASRRG